jgi:hypothetical protein
VNPHRVPLEHQTELTAVCARKSLHAQDRHILGPVLGTKSAVILPIASTEPHGAGLCLGDQSGIHSRRGAEPLFSFMKISPYGVSDQSGIWNRFTLMPALVLFPPAMTWSSCNIYGIQYATESGMHKQAATFDCASPRNGIISARLFAQLQLLLAETKGRHTRSAAMRIAPIDSVIEPGALCAEKSYCSEPKTLSSRH